MSEKSEKYVKLLKKHSDKIAIAVLWLFAVALGFIWYSEQEGSLADVANGEIAKFENPVEKNSSWPTIQAMATKVDQTSYPAVMQVKQYNMFDYKSVAGQQDIERKITAGMTQAADLEKAGQADQAMAALREVLKLKPSHKPAREALERLQKAQGGGAAKPAAGATPAPAK